MTTKFWKLRRDRKHTNALSLRWYFLGVNVRGLQQIFPSAILKAMECKQRFVDKSLGHHWVFQKISSRAKVIHLYRLPQFQDEFYLGSVLSILPSKRDGEEIQKLATSHGISWIVAHLSPLQGWIAWDKLWRLPATLLLSY
jgi:hypothetical protein